MSIKNAKIGSKFWVEKIIDDSGDENLIGHIGKVVEVDYETPRGTISLAFGNGKIDEFYPDELATVLPD